MKTKLVLEVKSENEFTYHLNKIFCSFYEDDDDKIGESISLVDILLSNNKKIIVNKDPDKGFYESLISYESYGAYPEPYDFIKPYKKDYCVNIGTKMYVNFDTKLHHLYSTIEELGKETLIKIADNQLPLSNFYNLILDTPYLDNIFKRSR